MRRCPPLGPPLGLFAVALLLTLAGPAPGADSASADRLAALREAIAGAEHLQLQRVALSPEGRDIPLVVATARPDEMHRQIRVLVIAGQHGDEPAPEQAARLWLQQQASRPAVFRRVAVLLLPRLNPDGAARGSRSNAAGVDLNRDWSARSQPETRLAQAIFDKYQPHVVVDLHAFDGVDDHGRRTDLDWVEMLELADSGRGRLDRITRELARRLVEQQRAVGEPVRTGYSQPNRFTLTLAHRHFAFRHGAVALLFEVGDGRADPEARLLTLLVDELDRRAGELKPALDELRGVASWRGTGTTPTAANAVPAPQTAPPLPADSLPDDPAPVGVALGLYVAVLVLRTKFRPEEADI